ncbi:hypothetical protein PAXRUDRAFT_171268, partial [Paxillus rubicundulus Ve08.2h10]
LMLTEGEWKRVKLFASLVTHADDARQSFSSDKGCTLQHALTALEALHKAWTIHPDYERYIELSNGLDAATDKLAEYYNCTADSDAYTLSILLDPSQNLYFRKYWGRDLHAQVLKNAE